MFVYATGASGVQRGVHVYSISRGGSLQPCIYRNALLSMGRALFFYQQKNKCYMIASMRTENKIWQILTGMRGKGDKTSRKWPPWANHFFFALLRLKILSWLVGYPFVTEKLQEQHETVSFQAVQP